MKKIKRYISCVLIAAMLSTCLQDFTPKQVNAATKTTTSSTDSTQSEKTTVSTKDSETIKETKIVKEVVEKREKNIKQFLKQDGSYEAVVYNTPVHYLDNGEWKDIDNTLVSGNNNGNEVLQNVDNDFNVKFAKDSKSNKLVTLQNENYELSWSLVGSLKVKSTEQKKDEEALNSKIEKDTDKKLSADSKYQNINDTEKVEAKSVIIENEKKKTLEKINSTVDYSNILKGTDLQYKLEGNKLKENIILKEKLKNPQFTFSLNVKNLVAKQEANHSITFYDSKDSTKAVYNIQAPYMYDAKGAESNKVDIKLEKNKDGYKLILTPDSGWINSSERQYPITIDPPVSTPSDIDKIHDTFVCSNDTDDKWNNSYLRVGYLNSVGITRSLIKFDLPKLNPGDMVTKAYLNVAMLEKQGNISQVNVHKITESWSDIWGTVWNNQPGYDSHIEDYIKVNDKKQYFDITAIAKDWYNSGTNNGLLLKSQDESEGSGNLYYASSDIGEDFVKCRPSASIEYISNVGLESYWDYQTQDLGRSGTGYVNTYNGNLVYSHSDLSMTGNRMPISIGHVYNGYQASQDSNIGYGVGFRLNLSQRIDEKDISGKGYYVYTDADGTEHYFEKKDGTSTYEDELKLGYKLTKNGDGSYLLSDKQESKLGFDNSGRLVYLEDTNGNRQTLSYDGDHLSTVTDPTGRKATLTYEGNHLVSITDPDGRMTTFSYFWDYLEKVTYPDGNWSLFYYDLGKHLLTRAQGIDGTVFKYYYGTVEDKYVIPRVKKIETYGTDGQLGFEDNYVYDNNTTTISSYPENKNVTYQFDDWGKTVSVKNNEGYAQYYKYQSKLSSDTKMSLSSDSQKTSVNYINNHNIEKSNDWWFLQDSPSEATGAFSTDEKYIGQQSLMVNKSNIDGRSYFEKQLTLEKGKTYTFSSYIKTEGMSNNNGQGAHLLLFYKNNQGEWVEQRSSYVSGNSDWQRYEETFTIPSDASDGNVILRLAVMNETGTAYFDCVQLEDGNCASRYNLVSNSELRPGNSFTDFWGTSGGIGGDDNLQYCNDSGRPAPMDQYAYKMTGNASSSKVLSQDINVSGGKGTAFVLSGWGKGYSVPSEYDNGCSFSLQLALKKNDGSTQKLVVDFNYACKEWQYISDVIVADGDFNSITVEAHYDNNSNDAYFDGIQVYKEEFGTSFSYDNNGNLKSTANIAKEQSTYDYSNNNLTKLINPSGTSFDYRYDLLKNLKGSINSEGVRSQFNYDNFGNPVSSVIQSDAQSTTVTDGELYYIRSQLSGKYLDSVQGTYCGKNVIQNTFSKSASQMWKAVSTGDGYFKLVPQNAPEYCLDVSGPSSSNGAIMHLWSSYQSDSQKFKIKANFDGTYGILTKISGCSGGLDVTDFQMNDGVNIQQYAYNFNGYAANQLWNFEKVPEDERVFSVEDTANELDGKVVYLYNKNSNKVVQVGCNIDQNGAEICQYGKKIDSGMKWKIQNAGDGYVYFVSMCSSSGRVLGFPDGNIDTPVQLKNNDKSDLVKYKIIKDSNGSYKIINKASGYGLAVRYSSKDDLAKVTDWPYEYAGPDREWYLQDGSYDWCDSPKANKSYYIKSNFNSQFFDINAISNNIGATLTQFYFTGEQNQKIKLIDCNNGYFKLQPLHSTDGKVIELNMSDGSYKLTLNTNITSDLQQFKFIKNNDGTYKIINKQAGTGYVIEIPNNSNNISEPLKMTYNSNADSNQNQQWVLEEISDMLTSSATYTKDGDYLANTTDSRGKTTTYNYNTTKGTLDSVVNANSVATNYTYNKNNDTLEAVAQSGVRVSYTYNKDKLNTITTGNNNVYSFGYDNFNRNTSVKVGTQTLVTNAFDNKGLLTQSTYGNGQTVGYSYDSLDRVTEKKYNNVVKAAFTFDNEGNVSKSTDNFVNTTTNFTYDGIKRLVNASTRSNGQIIHTINFKYDDKNRVSDFTNTVAGVSTKTAYEYSNTSLINGVSTTQGSLKLDQNYVYDSLARITQKKITLNGDSSYQTTYSYLQGATAGTTTTLVDSVTNDRTVLKYEYDNLGNITKIYENGVLKSSYTYDNLNQLKTETRNGITITYSYDLGGNITSKTTAKSTGSSTINYTYGNANWKDLLTSYNGQSITYDAIGNPLTYGGTTFTWQNGRRLATMSKSGKNAAYTYNVDGIRTKKVVNGVTTDYYLNGSNIVTQISGSDRLDFAYDESGNVYGFTYNNMTYAYMKNAQNDIIGIIDDCGDVVVTYEYDAWGNLLSYNDYTSYDIGSLNPFRYRGYYYDDESGLFYVGSRYYNPEWGRFINADGLVSTGQGLLGNNMFAYCGNNPVNNMDPNGCAFVSISIRNKKTDTYDFMPEKQTMPPYADHPNVIEQSDPEKDQLENNPAALTDTGDNISTYASESDASVIARMLYGEDQNAIEAHLWVLENRRIAGGYGGSDFRSLVLAKSQFSCMHESRSLDPASKFGDPNEVIAWDSCVDMAYAYVNDGIGAITKPSADFNYTWTYTYSKSIKEMYPNGVPIGGTWFYNK